MGATMKRKLIFFLLGYAIGFALMYLLGSCSTLIHHINAPMFIYEFKFVDTGKEGKYNSIVMYHVGDTVCIMPEPCFVVTRVIIKK